MASLLADLFISVDGHARGTRSPAYFGFGGPELEGWIRAEMDRPQRVVMGRRTFEALAAIPDEGRDEGWLRIANTPTLVFSRTLESAGWPNASVVSDDVVEAVRELKADGPDLRTVGSLSLVRQLLGAGLVDRLRLLVFPLVLGGTGQEPMFDGLGDIAFELAGATVLDGRLVLLDYRPTGEPPYAA